MSTINTLPSSSFFSFCTTTAAGRTDDDENAACWRGAANGDTLALQERVPIEVCRGVLLKDCLQTEELVVYEDAEKRFSVDREVDNGR